MNQRTKSISRLFLWGTSILVLLSAACASQQGSPTATTQATFIPTSTATSTSTVTVTTSPTATLTVSIPITGPTTASLVCEFCIDTFTHALVVIPAAATFTVLSPAPSASTTDIGIGCNTVDRFQDKQIVLCRAPSNTSLSMDVCQGNDCHQFTVRLQICPPPVLDTATLTPTLVPTGTPITPVLPAVSPSSAPTVAGSATPPIGTPIISPTAPSVTPIVSPTATP